MPLLSSLARRERGHPDLPIGRRLAVDAQRGRLWVVCTRCLRWCLSPIEERWEAFEECERLYRSTTRRVATSHIGLAKLASGLEIVRIGKPERPEFAAWRYGSQLLNRRRRAMPRIVLREIANHELSRITLGVAAQLLPAVINPLFLWATVPVGLGVHHLWRQQPLTTIWDRGRFIEVRRRHLTGVRLRVEPDDADLWRLDLPHDRGRATLRGAHALGMLGTLLVPINSTGASDAEVEIALRKLEWFGGSDGVLRFVARDREKPVTGHWYTLRLALEMSVHEEQERRALEGELAMLEAAWREAEEIAGLSDQLLLAPKVTADLERLRDRTDAE